MRIHFKRSEKKRVKERERSWEVAARRVGLTPGADASGTLSLRS